MPELPEVETMVRGLQPLRNLTIESLGRYRCSRKPISIRPTVATIRRRLVGRQLLSISRLAKRVVLEFSSGDRLVFEPRMTGLLLSSDPPTTAHLRFFITFLGAPHQFWFWDRRGLGTITAFSNSQWQLFMTSKKLGPDALAITADSLQTRLQPSRRPIKVVLMDQQYIAGIGNLYASEILFRANIDPRRQCESLGNEEWQTVSNAIIEVLQDAIAHEGSTLSDGTYRNALNQNGSYQNQHCVYARSDKRCRECQQTDIVRIVQNQRATFYCPVCQV